MSKPTQDDVIARLSEAMNAMYIASDTMRQFYPVEHRAWKHGQELCGAADMIDDWLANIRMGGE